MHDTSAAETVEHHVLEVLNAPAFVNSAKAFGANEDPQILLRELLIHFLQATTVGVPVCDKVFSGIDKFAALCILDVALFGKTAQEDLADCRAENNSLGVLLFCDLGDVL